MFDLNRVYSNRDPFSGTMQWFYHAREGVQGPFASEQAANLSLQNHLEHCKRLHIDGGRNLGLSESGFSLTAKQ